MFYSQAKIRRLVLTLLPLACRLVDSVAPRTNFQKVGLDSFKIHDAGGNTFTGTHFLASALSHNLPSDLKAKLEGCNVYLRGDPWDPRRKSEGGHQQMPDWGSEGRTWLIVNGEPFSSDAIRDTAMQWMGPSDKLVVLGSWVNKTTAEEVLPRSSSLWVPYASLYFADRHDR